MLMPKKCLGQSKGDSPLSLSHWLADGTNIFYALHITGTNKVWSLNEWTGTPKKIDSLKCNAHQTVINNLKVEKDWIKFQSI